MRKQLLKNKQYPPQEGAYLVKAKSGDVWQEHVHCRMHISVGREYHEGDKLKATIDWAANRFSHVTICVNDTLQAYTIAFEKEIPLISAYDVALREGNSWIKRNNQIILQYTNVHIIRWEDWKADTKQYNFLRKSTQNLYEKNIVFRESINNTIENFWSRKTDKKIYSEHRYKEFYDLSLNYLLEEVSVVCSMINKKRAIDIYPGTMLEVFDIMKNKTIEDAPIALTQRDFLRIDFSRNKRFLHKEVLTEVSQKTAA